jgi:hypothetical protein
MLILRKPPFPISATYSGLEAGEDFTVLIKSSTRNETFATIELPSTNAGKLTIEIPEGLQAYDDEYALEVLDEAGDVVIEDNLTVERPYVDPSTLATTASDIAKYTEYESLARAIIDSVTGGFYFRKDYLETTAQGTDYLSLWDRTYKILKAYENSILVYDSSLEHPALDNFNYLITKDKTAIIKDPVQETGEYNRSESAPVGTLMANSDSISMFDTSDSGVTLGMKFGVLFPAGFDYIFEVEKGYKVVPYDIQDATRMLIEDIACGKLEYFKRSIAEYSTDQFKIKIEKSALSGTGNILVDKILDKYITDVKKPGVL